MKKKKIKQQQVVQFLLVSRGRVYMELAVEILSGGTGSESKLAKKIKPVKDAKAGKAGGKDGKTPAGGGAGAAAGGAADDDKAAAEVLPVESPPAVRAKILNVCFFNSQEITATYNNNNKNNKLRVTEVAKEGLQLHTVLPLQGVFNRVGSSFISLICVRIKN